MDINPIIVLIIKAHTTQYTEMRHFLLSFSVWVGLLFLATGVTGLRLRKSHFLHLPALSQDSKQNHWRPALPTAYIVLICSQRPGRRCPLCPQHHPPPAAGPTSLLILIHPTIHHAPRRHLPVPAPHRFLHRRGRGPAGGQHHRRQPDREHPLPGSGAWTAKKSGRLTGDGEDAPKHNSNSVSQSKHCHGDLLFWNLLGLYWGVFPLLFGTHKLWFWLNVCGTSTSATIIRI
ncbi:uncharacterized protein LOC129599648 isoform X1 [Paramacrobiotus metropolitanus]|uniref:uncharacterized protein LOC129599648 isoform X1 n=1 Tax=Paramacrobiotus metropolitanus TaxID=2943436 RepID=UPI0024461008|nr:uncharacterized protein LOC129599648 isoform X1 [Paramacrobiotus metropolitanus]